MIMQNQFSVYTSSSATPICTFRFMCLFSLFKRIVFERIRDYMANRNTTILCLFAIFEWYTVRIMIHSDINLIKDIERVKQLSIVPTILDVVCQTTGMGFAAIARVTQDRWIACSVRDDIQFGLVPGGELEVGTTICNEIRDSHQAVIIDHVEESDDFCNHPTPRMYGFQSYISFPIILKNGDFFGTLCAIDPKPALLNNPKIIGMFNLFSDLISFHLQQAELLERSTVALQNLNQKLLDSVDENRQYRHISNHNLQEPLRKIRLFSGLLVDATEKNDVDKAKSIAFKIESSAQKLSIMIKDLSVFSELSEEELSFERVDLNEIIADVCRQLSSQVKARNATIRSEPLPLIKGIPLQLEHVFYHLLNNAIKFSKQTELPVIAVSVKNLSKSQLNHPILSGNGSDFVEIQIQDNGIGIERSQLEKIFDIFSQVPFNSVREGEGFGLAYCRKIIRNHSGIISAQSELGKGTTLSIILPLAKKLALLPL
jgi:signal transduction histidine kinase